MERAKHKKNAFQKHWLMAKTHSNIFNEQRSQHNELKHKRIPKNGTDFKNTYKHIRKARELAEHMKTRKHPIRMESI